MRTWKSPRHRIVGLRHRVVHDYFDVDLDLVWAVVRTRALATCHAPHRDSRLARPERRAGRRVIPRRAASRRSMSPHTRVLLLRTDWLGVQVRQIERHPILWTVHGADFRDRLSGRRIIGFFRTRGGLIALARCGFGSHTVSKAAPFTMHLSRLSDFPSRYSHRSAANRARVRSNSSRPTSPARAAVAHDAAMFGVISNAHPVVP